MGSSPIQQATAPVTLEVFREHLERVSSRSVGSIPTWGTKLVRRTGHNSIFYVFSQHFSTALQHGGGAQEVRL